MPKCPSNHWNNGHDVCADCGEDLNPAETARFAEFQSKIRASERLICESDLYHRTNRWAVAGQTMLSITDAWKAAAFADSALHDSRNPNVRFRR